MSVLDSEQTPHGSGLATDGQRDQGTDRLRAVKDDWRLQVELHETGHIHGLVEELKARELEHDLSTEFADRVIVSRNDATVFLYAGTREQIEAARKVVARLDKQNDWEASIDLRRWHPIAEEWEDPDEPLPMTDAEKAAEREELMSAERRESEETGYPEYEVRIDLPSRHEAVDFADRLGEEGIPVVRRWSFMLVGAACEDDAKALAERIRNEAPPSSKIVVEGTWREAYAEQLPNPFAVLGGLGS